MTLSKCPNCHNIINKDDVEDINFRGNLTTHYARAAGQWVEPGESRSVVVMSGRQVMQIICQQDKKNSLTSTP